MVKEKETFAVKMQTVYEKNLKSRVQDVVEDIKVAVENSASIGKPEAVIRYHEVDEHTENMLTSHDLLSRVEQELGVTIKVNKKNISSIMSTVYGTKPTTTVEYTINYGVDVSLHVGLLDVFDNYDPYSEDPGDCDVDVDVDVDEQVNIMASPDTESVEAVQISPYGGGGESDV